MTTVALTARQEPDGCVGGAIAEFGPAWNGGHDGRDVDEMMDAAEAECAAHNDDLMK